MNVIDYASAILFIGKQDKRDQAIAKLKSSLVNEFRQNHSHKNDVQKLVTFLESDSNDIEDLRKVLKN